GRRGCRAAAGGRTFPRYPRARPRQCAGGTGRRGARLRRLAGRARRLPLRPGCDRQHRHRGSRLYARGDGLRDRDRSRSAGQGARVRPRSIAGRRQARRDRQGRLAEEFSPSANSASGRVRVMALANERVAWFNGKIVRESEVVIPFRDQGFLRGDAVFDMTRSFNGKVFRIEEHIARLYRSLRYLDIDPGVAPGEMVSISEEVLERNRHLLSPGEDYWLAPRPTPRPRR